MENHCPYLDISPYVCNGCKRKPSCVLRKYVYYAKSAQTEYEKLLSSSRSGLNMTEDELDALDQFVSPLIRNGQSINHIVMTQGDALIRSSRTIYRLVHARALSARSLDMPRVCRLKPRRARPNPLKVEKACRIGRSFADYQSFVSQHPDLPVVQMDSVMGRVGGKVLLTLHLTAFDFMLAILRDQNTARSVTASLLTLRQSLSPSLFAKIFPVLLTDNGSEFSAPSAIEFSDDMGVTTRVFYCDPLAAYQKPNVELNHEFIRRFLPKGSSFDFLTQGEVSLMMSHINSYARSKFGGLSPSQLFAQAYGDDTLRLLGQALIPPEKIVLNRSIFGN
jgi:IS30 family transposase